METNCLNLEVDGYVAVDIHNSGNSQTNGQFKVTIFEDVNNDSFFDSEDTILGESYFVDNIGISCISSGLNWIGRGIV